MIQTYSLIVIDVLAIFISYTLAFFIRYGSFQNFGQVDVTICLLLVLFCVTYALLLDWNHFVFKRGYFEEMMAILKYDTSLLVALGFSVFLFKQSAWFSRLVFGMFGIFTAVFTYVFHLFFKRYMRYYYRKSASSDKVLLVTSKAYVAKLLEDIRKEKGWSYEVTAIAVTDDEMQETEIEGIPVIAHGCGFVEGVMQHAMDAAFLYLPDEGHEKINQMIEMFETMGVTCYYSVGNLDRKKSVQTVDTFAGHLVIAYEAKMIDYRRRFIKRIIDICGAVVGLAITMVLTPFVALAIKLDSKGPVFFSQVRVGKNGRRFKIYKFRSMYMDAEARKKELMDQNEVQGLMFKMEKDPRITKVGNFLRKTSIDELPQFYNVLRGDMSLVGTRPPTVDEFEQYSIRYRRRLSITPGLTGMWQVSGRSDIKDFEEVVKLDLSYIDNWSLTLDFKIILQTIGVVLFHKGSK